MRPWIVATGVVMYGFTPMFAEEPKPSDATTKPVTTAPAEAKSQPTEVGSQPPRRVRLETTLGDIVIELDDARAPVTCQNFRDYVSSGYYDGTIFHRVIPDFMIQGGGFTPNLDERKEGLRPPIKNEAGNGLKNVRGTIAMARTPDPNSATAQFFINVVNNDRLDQAGVHEVPVRQWPEGLTIPPDLSARVQRNEARQTLFCRNGPLSEADRDRLLGLSGERVWQFTVNALWSSSWGYCVFGKVVEGMDVVDKIRHTETGPNPKYMGGQSKVVPVQPVIIRSARLIVPGGAEPPVPQTLPTEGKDADTSGAGRANK